VDGVLVFDKEKFMRFVNNKAFLPDSYTSFKNKIGLAAGERYLSENKDVVLAWAIEDLEQDIGLVYQAMGLKGCRAYRMSAPRWGVK